MFFLLVLLAVVFCAVVIYLPYAAGLTTVQKAQHKQQSGQQKARKQQSGYITPYEELRMRQEDQAKFKKLSDKIKLTSEEMPIRIGLNQNGLLRKRGTKIDVDRNPNNYDYDLDELIKDETEGEAERAAAELYFKQNHESNKEELV